MLKLVTDRWRFLLLVAAAAGVLGAPARSARAEEEPEALIRQGVEMRRQGDDLKAHGYFQRAYDIARTPRSAAQLGLADLAIHDNLAAEQHLSEALASSDPWVRQNRPVLEKSRENREGPARKGGREGGAGGNDGRDCWARNGSGSA